MLGNMEARTGTVVITGSARHRRDAIALSVADAIDNDLGVGSAADSAPREA